MARTNQTALKTARWQATRVFVSHRASLRCEHCFTFLGMAGDVDHVVPRGTCEDVGIGVYDPTNLQYLCTSCHSAKTNRERWAGHEKAVPTKHRRSNVSGREDYLAAAGINPSPQQKESPC